MYLHGDNSGVESTVDANDEPANDDHLKRSTIFGGKFKCSSNYSKYVVQKQSALENTKNIIKAAKTTT